MTRFRKLLIANRGEIAIRVMRAANELGIRTAAIFAEQDKLALHRFKADEAYRVGRDLGPVKAYLSIEEVLRVAKACGADAIHPGYGFLSENPDFAQACERDGIAFIGPQPETMRLLGDKVSARAVAAAAGVPVMPATEALGEDEDEVRRLAAEIGYPLMLKAAWGGGGRGMRVIHSPDELTREVAAGRREAVAAFGNGDVFLEKLVQRARHVEVQILGDLHGCIVHLFERDCSVQRRNQKVVERAPAPYLSESQRAQVCDLALKLAHQVEYQNAGTVEFLMDVESEAFYFIEVNPRVQVEHTVTEQVTGIDIVKAQIRIAQGAWIGDSKASGVPAQQDIKLNGHALQCRITSEDPLNSFIPDYGRITAYRGATGFGIRLDGGTAYSGAVITRFYDSLLEKVTAWAPDCDEAIARMRRALREFRIRGVATNLVFVENLIDHAMFRDASYTTRFIDEHPELFEFEERKDRATKLLNYIADIAVNGHPDVAGRAMPPAWAPAPAAPDVDETQTPPPGTRQLLQQRGPRGFAEWMLAQEPVLVTDTTMRDAHQSLLATRMRTYDIVGAAEAYAHTLPQLFSLECWGGATFDVAMRFLNECPWQRLHELRERVPNVMLQMLLRGSNGVGYTNYPDSVVRSFTLQAAESGIDLFRVFDSLNWVENMRVAIDAVLESGRLCEAAICYTGNMLDPRRAKYDLDYYLKMARELAASGTHILGVKDMAGVLKPDAARLLIKALKEETGLPVHFHTHDTSGVAAATVLAAVEAGVDAVDLAMDSLSGLTSQPNMGSVVEALRDTDRDTGLDPSAIREMSTYWEAVRLQYAAFEPDLKSGASEVYLHEMPGGQFTNLKEQARALGLTERWHEVAHAYADVNRMFGDIVKVTPSSKIVGDMALSMVSAGLSCEDVTDPEKEIAFPDSVISFFKGEIGQPPGGFPQALQRKVLKDQQPLSDRPGAYMPALDVAAERQEATRAIGRELSDCELDSYLMYPKVFVDYAIHNGDYGPMHVLPSKVFFYGMQPREEIAIDLERGKTLIIRCQAIGETNEQAEVRVFFELNGQPRTAKVTHRVAVQAIEQRPKADPENPGHVTAPMPGMVSTVAVHEGQSVSSGDVLLTIEAMKMETSVIAEHDGVVARLYTPAGTQIDAKDLLVELSLRQAP